ncbi:MULTISPECIES: YadA family autotransporter adhesin [unclassified Halomonas]|uniref:YadA family autotransporter adhesin n=1 Tax=unclassified Halomonas TaxID=2609666 RepID=UPI001C9734C2|nr:MULTISPECIES: YadA-like family protein [unclassified Halomonas]MBY5923771.1 YadA-like family protein [Halomonas sp. DP4Y7-2]MBY6230813.1 YadA-like family protein [Halomonas sp. DP4Y7-1]
MDHEGTLLNTSQATNGNGTSPLSSDCNAAEGVSEATDEDTAAISGYSAAISTRQLRATGAQAIEMGDGSEASGGKSIAIGVDSAASGDRSIALGDSSTSSATRAVSLGSSVTASAENSVVIGTDSSIATNAINATAIGYSNSVSDQSKYTSVLGMKNTIDGNAVRVLGNNNEINAAYAGISGSNNTVSSVSSHANVVGNNAAVDGLEAIVVGNFGVASADHTIVLGAEGASTAEEAIAIGHGASASEASSVALGSNSVTDAAVATSGITLAGTDYTFAGSSPIATVGIGSAGQERTLTHLAAGRVSASSTDAINGSQLYATNQAVEGISSRVDDLEGQYASLSDDALTYDAGSDKGSLTLGGQNGTSITNLADGDISSGSTDAVTGGQLWDLSQQLSGAGGGGGLYSNISSSGPGAQIDAADGIAMGGGARVEEGAEGGIALGSGSIADRGGMNGAREAFSDVAVGSTAGALSVGSAGGERQITNVAGGTEATDAVNVRQLESVQAGAVNYDRHEDGSVDYGSVTLGDAAAGPTTVHNVGPGVADTDAANVGQLNALNQNVQRQFSRLADKIGDVEDEANAGSATAIAMASVPQAYLPGRSMIAVGGGNYSGESAAAVGVSHLTENGKWAFKLNGSGDSQGNMGVGVGAGFHW